MSATTGEGAPGAMPLARIAARLRADPILLLSLLAVVAIVGIAVFAPWIAPHDPYLTNMAMARKAPGWVSPDGVRYLLGTDVQGRDILSRVIYGIRATLTFSGLAVVFGSGAGALLGIFAAYFRQLDGVVMRVVDVLLSFPAILFGLSLSALLGPGTLSMVLALAISAVPGMARIARGSAMVVMKQEYMEAGHAMGFGNGYLIFRYLLPNCSSMLMIYATLQLGHTILLGAVLSFLGLGPQPPFAELGSMAADGRKFLQIFPHISTIPTMTIFLIVLAFNLLGDSLRDALDPKLRT
ncbi:glutathione ABC transporter permease GsiD [Bordetella genomosp. 10]|uniref:Glutathione ABC transporter permease GsiD n=1 Tax=Bordetella genomosp. 10 TaxID=1416804 RepID=A0A261SK55_9BORD|nr:ABC transporter permease [Bordetella genomosp. 10]OZI37421.1 glutathione ABC transporter permease GsiD [Bordetella genomosp. 10]